MYVLRIVGIGDEPLVFHLHHKPVVSYPTRGAFNNIRFESLDDGFEYETYLTFLDHYLITRED